MRYLINMSYDGSKFYGYQIQNKNITVEGEIEKALSKILNQKINTIGASRTDRGVHANNQYCHFDFDILNTKKLAYSINSIIDKSIYVKKISKVDDSFHARYGVSKKEYVYIINMGEYNPIEKDYVYQYNKPINKESLNKFIILMSGNHNFKSFTSDTDKENYDRNITISYKITGKKLYLKFESSGFLRYMIRNIVGLLLEINDGKKALDDINKIFDAKDRSYCGKCSSPVGLYLNKVEY